MQILIIQTAFTGDVVLATPLIEKLDRYFPGSAIDFLLRKGNEELLLGHPKLRNVLVWDKRHNKFINLLTLIKRVRKTQYDLIINLHRYLSTGLLCLFSGADEVRGFQSNPASFFYDFKVKYSRLKGVHEVQRNLSLIADLTDTNFERPNLYPSEKDRQQVSPYMHRPYMTLSPGSVWKTKQFPIAKWLEFVHTVSFEGVIYLLGSREDGEMCDFLVKHCHRQVVNLAGRLSMPASAALMEGARMNYVNDSAPLHFASAMNAPVTAVFCSTVPGFGFGPLSDRSYVVEVREKLSCRPCGVHGRKKCPKGHFRCGEGIDVGELAGTVNSG